jgi:hypothetical protein
LPSSRSAESGTWTEVPGFYHIHSQHCLYDAVTWQKQSQQQSTAINHNPLDIITWQQQVIKGTAGSGEFMEQAQFPEKQVPPAAVSGDG